MRANNSVIEPATLLPPAPRRVYRRRGWHPLLKLFLYCLIPHVWVGVSGVGFIVSDIALGVAGENRTATVVSRDITQSKGKRYSIEYR